METITIKFNKDVPLPSGLDFLKPFAEGLAQKIGWIFTFSESLSEAYVTPPNSSIYFRFRISSNNNEVYVSVYNGYGKLNRSTSFLRRTTEYVYKIFVLHSGEGTVAIGFGYSTTVDATFELILAQNANGEYVGLIPRDYGAASDIEKSDWLCLREMETNQHKFRPALPTDDTIASGNTAIFKLPDIFGGCMFKDIYGIWSCPRAGANRKLYINGVTYRVLSSSDEYSGIAIPDINN